MIDHAAYRRQLLADPRSAETDEMRAHSDGCAECSRFAAQVGNFESRLERALAIDVPAHSNVTQLAPKARPRPRVQRWLALAASFLLVVGVAATLWTAAPERSLAAAVVTHMADEPDAWRRTDQPVGGGRLDSVLQDSKLRLMPGAGLVSYANSCEFRGHMVPHLVVQSASGPVTVMVLVHEPARMRMHFAEQGYHGTIVPVAGHGSLAVLMQDPGKPDDVDAVAARVQAAIVWTP
jgi:hypothetical protein